MTTLNERRADARWKKHTEDELTRLRSDFDELGEQCIALRAREAVLVEALAGIASGTCCETPGCNTDDPKCDTMLARQALAALDVPDPKEQT